MISSSRSKIRSVLCNINSRTTVRFKSGSLNKLLFYQLFEKESSTYTYLLADSSTNDAILIDPVLETCGR